jgi:hypothetical protein
MSRVKIKGQPIEGPFVAVLKDTLKAPAWRAMSHGARSLYICLKSRYNSKQHNNGRLYVSQRQAAQEIGSSYEQIARWFRELRHYGFIVMTTPACLGVDGKGKAPHWRLTECGYMNDPPTRDFLRWDGGAFNDIIRPRRKKQNPVAENRNALVAENRNTLVAENRNTKRNKCCGKPQHTANPPRCGKPQHF